MTNAELVAEFVGYCFSEKGLSPLTVKAYERYLRQFVHGLDKPLSETGQEDIGNFLSGLNPLLSGNSKALYFSPLRQFFLFLQRDGHIQKDPTAGMRAPKQSRRLPKVLTEDEVERLIELPGRRVSYELNLRNRAILEVFYASAIRLSELAGLNCMDVRLKERTLLVRGKGR